MLPVVTIKSRAIDARRSTNNKQPKNLVCKRTEISTTSSTNLLYRIFARAKRLHRPGARKKKIEALEDLLSVHSKALSFKFNTHKALNDKVYLLSSILIKAGHLNADTPETYLSANEESMEYYRCKRTKIFIRSSIL